MHVNHARVLLEWVRRVIVASDGYASKIPLFRTLAAQLHEVFNVLCYFSGIEQS
jgi:hypothetical protein